MTDVTFRSDVTVLLDHSMGDDATIADTARVSRPGTGTGGDLRPKDSGLLNMLMRDRHGTPWESVVFRFYIEAPIFVAREAHRHRLASVNEESGRYKEVTGVFYLPAADRPLVQVGKPGQYTFQPGTEGQHILATEGIRYASTKAYEVYQEMLAAGVAREVARMCLPVNIYTSWFLTINLRALFNFLSLRRVTPQTTVPTFPQREIEMVAEQMEELAASQVPEAIRLFNLYGRVSP